MLFIRRLTRIPISRMHSIRFTFCSFNKQSFSDTSLIQSQDQGQLIQYWENQVSRRRPNSVSVDRVLRKIYLAEVLLGSEIQEKNWELYSEIFDPKFLEKIYIPQEFPNKYATLLSVQIELLMLEYRYRLQRKEKDQLDVVIKRIRKSLENIFQFELFVKDGLEAEFNHSTRLAMFHDLKSIIAKDVDMEKYIEEVEEQIRQLEKTVQLADQIIQQKDQGEHLKYEMSKNLALNKIGRNFEILAQILMSQGQDQDARAFLEKALEIYSHIQNELSARKIICECRIALTYMKSHINKGIETIKQLHDKIASYGDSPALLLTGMYYFTIKSRKEIDEPLYDKVMMLLDTYQVEDPIIIPQFLSVALKFTFQEKYYSALEKHIQQSIFYIENATEKHKLDQLIQQIGLIALELPSNIGRNTILRKVYECYEECKNEIDEESFYEYLLIKSFIKYQLLIDDGKQQNTAIQPLLSYIDESWKEDKDLNLHLKQLKEFVDNKQLDQSILEILYQRIALAKANKNQINDQDKNKTIYKKK